MKFQAPKGVSEYFPPRSATYEWVRDCLLSPIRGAGYRLVELPIFEDTELFTRGVGASTDVVSKEMYTFEDRGGRSITLRPEGTVGALRCIIEHGLDRGALPVKVFYSGQYFRAERPQAGRHRQFYSVGLEAVGSEDPALDAEIIRIAVDGFQRIGLAKFSLELTSLGDAASRAAHRVDLVQYIKKCDFDQATRARSDLNPLRLFDDKRPEIQNAMSEAPVLLNYLSTQSASHFDTVQRYLRDLKIEFSINSRMVRGLDYYTSTTFEFVHELLGAQSAIGGGGRYDGLMEEIGGQPLTGMGFGLGIDRAVLAAEAEGLTAERNSSIDLCIIPMSHEAKSLALRLHQELSSLGRVIEIAFGDRSVKAAVKAADKSGAKYVLVIGESEIASGTAEMKRMSTGESTSVTLTSLRSTLSQESWTW